MTEPKDRIIAALDVNDPAKANQLVYDLSEHVGCFKIGLEFIHAMLKDILHNDIDRFLSHKNLLSLLGGKIFWDGKLHDIPNTVAASSDLIGSLGVLMFNVHATGGERMMRGAKEMSVIGAKKAGLEPPLALAVTVLTSLSYDDLVDMGIFPKKNFSDSKEETSVKQSRVEDIVKHLALLAQDSGLDGVVCSPKEIDIVRRYCGPDFKIVTPGVRPVWASTDDQKRVMTPGEAIWAGADFLVIGRPITKPPADIGSPADAAKRIAEEISEALASIAASSA